jgi:hypothetical protein
MQSGHKCASSTGTALVASLKPAAVHFQKRVWKVGVADVVMRRTRLALIAVQREGVKGIGVNVTSSSSAKSLFSESRIPRRSGQVVVHRKS